MLLCYGQTTANYVKFLHFNCYRNKMLHHTGLWGKGDIHLKKTHSPPQKKIQTYTYVHFNGLVPDTTPFLVEKEQKEGKRWALPSTLDGPVINRAEAAKLEPSTVNQLLPVKWQFLVQSPGTLWALISLNQDCYQKYNPHFLGLLYAFFHAPPRPLEPC